LRLIQCAWLGLNISTLMTTPRRAEAHILVTIVTSQSMAAIIAKMKGQPSHCGSLLLSSMGRVLITGMGVVN
jgi:hypothetical protein